MRLPSDFRGRLGRAALTTLRVAALPPVYAVILLVGTAHLARRAAAVGRRRVDDPGFEAVLLALLLVAALLRDGRGAV